MEADEIMAVIGRLLREQMGLPETPPRVFFENTEWQIPKDDDIFLEISIVSETTYAAARRYAPATSGPDASGLDELQSVNQQTTFGIDIFSFDPVKARRRRQDIAFALQGTASQQAQERHGFKLGRPSPFTNLSGVEGARRLTRFETQVRALVVSGQTRSVEYFSEFQVPPKPVLVNQ